MHDDTERHEQHTIYKKKRTILLLYPHERYVTLKTLYLTKTHYYNLDAAVGVPCAPPPSENTQKNDMTKQGTGYTPLLNIVTPPVIRIWQYLHIYIYIYMSITIQSLSTNTDSYRCIIAPIITQSPARTRNQTIKKTARRTPWYHTEHLLCSR